MLKRTLLHTAFMSSVLIVLANAGASEPLPVTSPALTKIAVPAVAATASNHQPSVRDAKTPPLVHQQTLAEIATWVSQNFDIPASRVLPRVEIVSPQYLVAVRYRGFRGVVPAGAEPGLGNPGLAEQLRDVVALYEDASQTIYLREGWTGTTPAEVSLLVHEMVHHLQNLARLKYDCPQAREKPAYSAQRKWLASFGRDFFEEFETDPMTLLVRTTCGL